MLLKETNRNEIVEVIDVTELFNPFNDELLGRFTHGEEAQDPQIFKKAELIFQSGEALPKCWTDSHYRDSELSH